MHTVIIGRTYYIRRPDGIIRQVEVTGWDGTYGDGHYEGIMRQNGGDDSYGDDVCFAPIDVMY